MANLKKGKRTNLFVSRHLSDEFIDWCNMQSNLSATVWYALLELYKTTGYIDVAEVMPAKIDFDLQKIDNEKQAQNHSDMKSQPTAKAVQPESTPSIERTVEIKDVMESEATNQETKNNTTWSGLDDLGDDGFA